LRFARASYRHADAVVANSQAVARDVVLQVGVPARLLSVIYNPVNLEWIDAMSRESVSHGWLGEGKPPVILSAGRLSAEKDFGTLIRAFAHLRSQRQCRLLILGEGPDRASLEAIARDAGVERDFDLPGFVPNPIAWMHRARVFVSSSTTEGLPNVVMQALALGLPVVSTRSAGGVAELLGEGRWGTLVPVGDAGAMAKAIAASLDASHDARVRARAMDFAPSTIASQYLELLLPAHGQCRNLVASPEASRHRANVQE
jgi:glycosyltransferase involved in cell wall biosynthesis